MRGSAPETAIHAHAMTTPPPWFTDEVYAWDRRFIFGSSIHKHRSKTLLTLCAFLQTLILSFCLWCWSEVCISLCSVCNSVSESPEDSRLSEHHPGFLEVVGDFTDTSLRVHFYSFYDLSVINYCCFLSRSGSCWCRWWFPNSWFLHALCFCYSYNWRLLFF